MSRVRIEWVRLGQGADVGGGGWENIIEATYGTPVSLEVTTTVTVAGSRPTAPDFGASKRGHARIITDGPMVVAKGTSPTATLAGNGNYLAANSDSVISVATGDKLSFISAPAL